MKKSFKKILALLLAVIMVGSIVACASNDIPTATTTASSSTEPSGNGNTTPAPTEPDLYYNKTGYPICDEVITIKVGGRMGSSKDWNNTYLVKYVEEHLGIKMVCEPTADDVINEQYAKWLTNPDTMPDLILNTAYDRSQVDADGADGFFVNMAEYEELMPNLLAFLDEYPSLRDLVYTNDGAIYSLTRITTPVAGKINHPMYFHVPTLEAAGIDPTKINTVDEFYNALKALKEKYPDKTPFVITPDAEPAYRNELNLRTAFGVYSNDNSYMVCTDENGEVFLADTSDNQREYLKFVNKLADEGLIDINDIGRSADEIRADMKAGKYCIWTGSMYPVTAEDQALDTNGDKSWQGDYSFFWTFTSDLSDKKVYIANNGVLNQAKIMINPNSEYIEAIVRLLDFFATPEGQLLAVVGEEGKTFDWVVDPVTGVKSSNSDNYWDKTKYETVGAWRDAEVYISQALAFNWGFVGALDSVSMDVLEKIPANNSNWLSAQKLVRVDELDELRYGDVPALYTADQKAEMATLKTDLTSFLVAAKAEFIAGIRDPYSDADWDAFVKQVNAMGWEDTLKDIEQEVRGG